MEKPSRVAEYLSALSEDERAVLEELRETIRAPAPMATEQISYGMPTFHHRGNLVHHAAFKEHCSVGVLAEIPRPSCKADPTSNRLSRRHGSSTARGSERSWSSSMTRGTILTPEASPMS